MSKNLIEKIKRLHATMGNDGKEMLRRNDVLKILAVHREKLQELLNEFPIKHKFVQEDFVHDDTLQYKAYEVNEVDEFKKKLELLLK